MSCPLLTSSPKRIRRRRATGTNAAEASTKIVQNLIKTAIIEFLKKKLSPSVEEFMKKLADYMSDGIVSPWEEAELNKLKEKMDAEARRSSIRQASISKRIKMINMSRPLHPGVSRKCLKIAPMS